MATLGPIEILVLSFPESRFTGEILPELAKVVEDGTITIVDGLFVQLDDAGTPSYVELDELGANADVASLVTVLDHVEGLLSDDDVEQLVAGLEPGSSAAILVFEHTWSRPLRDAVVASGGVLLESTRISGEAVSEVQAAIAELA